MAKLRVPKPPAFAIGKKQISIEVVLAPTTGVQPGGLGQSTLSGLAAPTPFQTTQPQQQGGGYGTQQQGGGYGTQQQTGGGYGTQQQGGGYGTQQQGGGYGTQQQGGGYGTQQQGGGYGTTTQTTGGYGTQQQGGGYGTQQQTGGGYGTQQQTGGGYGQTTGGYGGGYGGATYTGDPTQPRILSEVPAPDLGAIRIAAEQLLSSDFTIVQQTPERVVRLNVSGFDPVRTSQSTMQQTVQDPAGQQVQVPVDVWEGVGRLSLRVEVVDPATGRVLDGFAPNAEFKQRGAIAVAGQQRVDPTTLPIAEGIWKGLVREVTNPLKDRYTTTVESIEFNLAADDELRPGNELAKNNYWKEALEKWQSATMKKPENEGDKIFNLGAAHEAMAYETMLAKDAVAAKPFFEKALQLYTEAARLDPKEKYITSATDRLKKTAVYLNRGIQQVNAVVVAVQQQQQVQQQLAAQQAAEADARAAAEKARLEAEAAARAAEEAKRRDFATPRADTTLEANFRKLAKVRLRALNAPATAEDQSKLQTMGQQVYKLQPVEAERVVFQESAKWTELLPRIQQYKETYAALFADKRIAPDEREVLKQLADTLGLAADESAAVEAQFQ